MDKRLRFRLWVEIPVAPEMQDRFKKGCKHYGMKWTRKRGTDYFVVYYLEVIHLYWLGANLFGVIPETGLHKQSF